MSLRARLMALILLATLVPALLLGWRFFQDSHSQIERALRLLEQSAANIVVALENRVQGTAQLHSGLAHSRVLDDDERQACSDYLSQVREAYPQFTGIISVRPNGQLHCDPLRSGRKLDLSDRAYFKRVLAGADQRHDLVAIDRATSFIDDDQPGRIAVERDSDIGPGRDDCFLKHGWCR